MKMEFEHIGVAVNNIDECLNGLKPAFDIKGRPQIHDDEPQNIKVSFVDLSGARVEMIAPLDRARSSPVDGLIRKNVSYYHLCFSTRSIEETIAGLVQAGAALAAGPMRAAAFGGKRIAFLLVKGLGLIEVVEKND